jgi:hypothetical protein
MNGVHVAPMVRVLHTSPVGSAEVGLPLRGERDLGKGAEGEERAARVSAGGGGRDVNALRVQERKIA